MTMATGRPKILEQVRAFVEGSEGLDFAVADRNSRNEFVRRMLDAEPHSRTSAASRHAHHLRPEIGETAADPSNHSARRSG